MKGIRIKDLQDLKDKSDGRMLECFMALNGAFRSSKNIIHLPENESFYIHHEIDDSSETLTYKEFKETLVHEALEKGALYQYDYS